MIRRPDIVGIKESDELASCRNIVEAGIARATRPGIGLADDRNARFLLRSKPDKLVRNRIGGLIVDYENVEILERLGKNGCQRRRRIPGSFW